MNPRYELCLDSGRIVESTSSSQVFYSQLTAHPEWSGYDNVEHTWHKWSADKGFYNPISHES